MHSIHLIVLLVIMIIIIVGADVLFFRDLPLQRLIANVVIVLLFGAFYWFFLK